jgi:hypothetical protein
MYLISEVMQCNVEERLINALKIKREVVKLSKLDYYTENINAKC